MAVLSLYGGRLAVPGHWWPLVAIGGLCFVLCSSFGCCYISVIISYIRVLLLVKCWRFRLMLSGVKGKNAGARSCCGMSASGWPVALGGSGSP